MESSNVQTFPIVDWVIALPEIALVSFLLMLLIYGSLNFLTPTSTSSYNLSSNHWIQSTSSYWALAPNPNFNNESKIRGIAAGLMKSRNVGWLAFLSLIFCFFLIVEQSQLPLAYIWQDLVRVSEFITLTKGFISLICLGLFLISFDSMKHDGINTFEFSILILLSVLSMYGILSSNDLLGIYLCIEMQSLSFYVLAAYKRTSEFSTEAGLKYFVLGVFSSGLLLFGSSLLYGFSGTTNFEELMCIFINSEFSSFFYTSGLSVGLLFLTLAFLFKLAAVPFHLWAPDVYEGSMTIVTILFSTLPKIVTLTLIIRLFFQIFFGFSYPWYTLLIISSIFSILWGSLASLNEVKFKRFMAFSGMSHVGYLFIGICAGGMGSLEQSIQSVQSIYFYLFVYMAMVVGTFTILLSLRRGRIGINTTKKSGLFGQKPSIHRISELTQSSNQPLTGISRASLPKYISDLNGKLNLNNPTLALTLSLIMFSFAGIPPFAGFFSKVYLIFTALEASLYILAFIGVLASVLSAFYYIRFIRNLYFSALPEWSFFLPMAREHALILSLVLFIIVLFAIFPAPLNLTSFYMGLVSLAI